MQDSPPPPHADAAHVPPISLVQVARHRPLALLRTLGPGLIAGASDVDPTTVASLAVIGATTVYSLSWLVVLVIPMLVVVQVISASVGIVARTGFAAVVTTHYGRWWARLTLVAVLLVNLIKLAADLEGGSAALGLLTGWSEHWFVLPLALGVAVLLIWGSYHLLQRVLRWVLLVFLSYVVTTFLAHPHWGQVLRATIVPHLSFSANYVAGALALLGTTLTSYAYVWETIEEAEEHPPLRRLGLAKLDAGLGMVAAGVVCWFIVIGTGATLGVQGHQVQTAQDAAAALAPLAGHFAAGLFGIGLLASAIVALPVLAGTSAYVVADVMGWREGLDRPFHQERPFYTALVLSLVVGVGVTFLGVGPIRLLFLSSIAGGLATPITLALLVWMARDGRVMETHRIGRGLAVLGWLVTIVVTVAGGIYLWQTVIQGGH